MATTASPPRSHFPPRKDSAVYYNSVMEKHHPANPPPPIDTTVHPQRQSSRPSSSASRKPLPSGSPVDETNVRRRLSQFSMGSSKGGERDSTVMGSNGKPLPFSSDSRIASEDYSVASPRDSGMLNNRSGSPDYQPMTSPVFRHEAMAHGPAAIPQPQSAIISSVDSQRSSQSSFAEAQQRSASRTSSRLSIGSRGSRGSPGGSGRMYPQHQQQHQQPQLAYFHQDNQQGGAAMYNQANGSGYDFGPNANQHQLHRKSSSPTSLDERGRHLAAPMPQYRRGSRPSSVYSYASNGSPHMRAPSAHSYDSRRSSFVDLPHMQAPLPPIPMDNSHIKNVLGSNATLLSGKQTLDMYRQNAKKTNDPNLQYEFAMFLVALAQSAQAGSPGGPNSPTAQDREKHLEEAFHVLQSLSNKHPQAQYYLADAYTTGLFTGKPDDKLAFPLFVAASKHGHAEAGYRAALCYEFGWGCRRDYAKAVQFYRQAASKNHPGAMTRLGKACLNNELGFEREKSSREGIKWLKRATEIASEQYNTAPYELGLLHETGYGEDVFHDPAYAAQLYTQAAGLGHSDAAFKMGEAYEHGRLMCPKDAALSVHFYTIAATRGHPGGMMALCAWYLVGAEPVLEKDEQEAYMWARKAAETGLPKAEYAVGYFTEMGIGCRQDALEANKWYVIAAEHGDERAKKRLATIKENAGIGGTGGAGERKKGKLKKGQDGGEACVVM